jgi:prolyl 4-hydroxylase
MINILQNKFVFFSIVLFLVIIILGFSYLSIKKTVDEPFGYDFDSNEYIEPKIYPNFITEEEAQYILNSSNNKYIESEVVGGINTQIRKSKTCWLDKNDATIRKIIQRVCKLGNYSFDNAEELQVVKYDPNGYYNEHHDSCCDNNKRCMDFNKQGGNRVITMVIYLNDDFDGGETRFINLDKKFKPAKYSGIRFYPMNKNGDKCHNLALHAGMPITSGNKYIANIWIRENIFE